MEHAGIMKIILYNKNQKSLWGTQRGRRLKNKNTREERERSRRA